MILGASVRAAAFSALRADLRPWCADLFADRDLRARCPVRKVKAGHYPGELTQIERNAPDGPWMYTGALENRPALLRAIGRRRTLWGNGPDAVRKARSPGFVADLLNSCGLPGPRLQVEERRDVRWLVKPRAGGGGTGIRFLDRDTSARTDRRMYVQEFIDGESASATYLGDGESACLLGVTRQLVGAPWLHAAAFRYCGSIGPLPVDADLRQCLEKLGNVLARGCGLRGLFGVDFIERDNRPWPVEINPRYTASVEVLEYAQGLPALALHRSIFEPEQSPSVTGRGRDAAAVIGKGILFARAPLVIPASGPWDSTLAGPADIARMPAFGDIPAVGEAIPAGRPVLTFFAGADTVESCRDALRRTAADLDRTLFGA